MAKKTVVKITGTEQAKKSALAFINNFKNGDEILNIIGKLTVAQIQSRTRDGGKTDNEYKQPPLKNITIETRNVLSRNNGTDGFYKKDRSNVTFTGQLLDSINYKISKSLGEISVALKDFRYSLLPLGKAEKNYLYGAFIDKDFNATNSKRKDQKDKDRISALFIASQKRDEKTNNQVRDDLEKRGFRFFFISERLAILLENRIAQELKRKLSIYSKLNRK